MRAKKRPALAWVDLEVPFSSNAVYLALSVECTWVSKEMYTFQNGKIMTHINIK